MRQEKSVPLLATIETVDDRQARDAIEETELAEATRYSLNQWDALVLSFPLATRKLLCE
jgi:hypothetical protein